MKFLGNLLCLLLLPVVLLRAQDSLRLQQPGKPLVPATPAAWYGMQPKAAPLQYNYYNSLGIACKAELKLEQATHIPLRVRLGSLAQTDYMEQKPNATRPEKQ